MDIIRDVTWGIGPEINIQQLDFRPNTNEVIKGRFRPSSPNEFSVDIDLILRYEDAISNNDNTAESVGEIAYLRSLLIYAVVLHEYVHFADFAFDGSMQDTEEIELGLIFEEDRLGGFFEIDPDGNIVFLRVN